MKSKKRSLTGIQPTGDIHIGNYFGAIVPSIENSKTYNSFYFIADYHALNGLKDHGKLKESSYKVAAAWLACGLDTKKVTFYKQSSIPQIFELETILACYMPKGLINRAHSYKDKVAKNLEANLSDDEGINMGLFNYPLLMAADILIFQSDVVPVGKDQKQHLEITRQIAKIINSRYNKNIFTIPTPQIDERKHVIGINGKKMSKSYNNTIPIFAPSNILKKRVMSIVTNSQTVGEKKDPTTCNIFAIYSLFATNTERLSLKKRYEAGGMGWGEAKMLLYEKIEETISPKRKKFNYLIKNKKIIEDILDEGSSKARYVAKNNLSEIKKKMGLI